MKGDRGMVVNQGNKEIGILNSYQITLYGGLVLIAFNPLTSNFNEKRSLP
jgi:hypothetical protein